MNILQTVGFFLGIVGGTVAGAMLGSGHGTLGYIAGAVCGGFVGMVVGTLSGTLLWYPCCIAYAFTRAAGKIYWQVLTGRRKLPTTSTKSERRHLFIFIGLVFVGSMMALGSVYLFGSETQRFRLLWIAVAICGTCIIGVALLATHHRRTVLRKAQDKDQ